MKIDDALKQVSAITTGSQETKSSKTANKASSGSAAENVTLSPASSQLRALASNLGSESVFDEIKVAEIKSAIAGGEFKVNTDKVAEGLINSVKELLTAQKP
ncbi:MAG: flagellar biosynthesis anti-sigma factor FlgM [Methylophilaceae bacterium]